MRNIDFSQVITAGDRFADAKASALANMLAILKAAEAPVLSKYTPGEIASFGTKADEARLILAGETDPDNVPIIAGEADDLGVNLQDVAQAVLGNRSSYARIISTVSSTRQQWSAAIEAAEDQADLDAAAETFTAALTAALSS